MSATPEHDAMQNLIEGVAFAIPGETGHHGLLEKASNMLQSSASRHEEGDVKGSHSDMLVAGSHLAAAATWLEKQHPGAVTWGYSPKLQSSDLARTYKYHYSN